MEKFDFNNSKFLNALIDRVVELWSPPTEDMAFRRLYVEAIIRQNAADNDMQFQLSDNDGLCSIAFASRLGEHTPWYGWWQEKFDALPEEEQTAMVQKIHFWKFGFKRSELAGSIWF